MQLFDDVGALARRWGRKNERTCSNPAAGAMTWWWCSRGEGGDGEGWTVGWDVRRAEVDFRAGRPDTVEPVVVRTESSVTGAYVIVKISDRVMISTNLVWSRFLWREVRTTCFFRHFTLDLWHSRTRTLGFQRSTFGVTVEKPLAWNLLSVNWNLLSVNWSIR